MKKALSEFPPYYIAKEIKEMLDKAKYQVHNKDWDRVYIIDGEEGAGKSLLGLQLGFYLDPNLSLDRIVFSGKQFSNAITNASKNQCIIFDEAFNGLDSTGATSKLNKFIVRKLMECRQKNLFIIIILPTIFLLQKYASIFRSKCLFHVYATGKGDRGYYRVYNKQNKKILYIHGRKLYSYSKPYITNSYRFYGSYPIDEKDYRKKKLESLEEEDEKEKFDRHTWRFALMAKLLKEKYNMSWREQERYLQAHKQTITHNNIAELVTKIPNMS